VEIIDMCPELEAVFTNTSKIEREEMLELSSQHPSIRCVMLGREIVAKTFIRMEKQLKRKHVLDLTGGEFELLSDAGIAELIRMPGLRDTLQAIFTDPSNDKVTEAAMLRLQE
jgi:hypothetical protein